MADATARLARWMRRVCPSMKELLRTNDVVKLSWLQGVALADAGIPRRWSWTSHTSDSGGLGRRHSAPADASIDDDLVRQACNLLAEAGEKPLP